LAEEGTAVQKKEPVEGVGFTKLSAMMDAPQIVEGRNRLTLKVVDAPEEDISFRDEVENLEYIPATNRKTLSWVSKTPKMALNFAVHTAFGVVL
jgi:hypothetical protein